jgi:hypothetical protein
MIRICRILNRPHAAGFVFAPLPNRYVKEVALPSKVEGAT